MNLTQEEKKMLAGDYGQGTALAMKILVAIGEAFDAERMVKISRAHVALSNQEADLWFAEKLASGGAKCRVTPTVNPGFNLDYFCKAGMVSEEDAKIMERTHTAYKSLGAQLSYSCTPYLFDNIPRFGEVVSFSESSATPYVNSVWGARTNREAAQSALCAAVTGCVPEYGLLLDENRKAQAIVEVEADMADDFAYELLGYCIPKKIGPLIPALVGMPLNPTPEALMNLGAQLNTAGATPIFHIVGVTPEAPSLEMALGGKSPEMKIKITDQDLINIREAISLSPGKIDFVMFGCPHHTLRQVQDVARMVEGKKLRTELWIMTSSYTREMAERMGLSEIIENAGGRIVDDTCWDQPCWGHLAGKIGATDSPKLAFYSKRRDMQFIVRSVHDCVKAALKGEVQ